MLLDRCAEAGIRLSVDGGVLHVDAPDVLTVDLLLDELKEHKASILETLTASHNSHYPHNTPRPDDPRPDLTTDHRLWVYLLRWAWLDDNYDALGVLDGVRCCGARLEVRPTGALRIVAGGGYLGDWQHARQTWLLPHRDAIAGWLDAIAHGEHEVSERRAQRLERHHA